MLFNQQLKSFPNMYVCVCVRVCVDLFEKNNSRNNNNLLKILSSPFPYIYSVNIICCLQILKSSSKI